MVPQKEFTQVTCELAAVDSMDYVFGRSCPINGMVPRCGVKLSATVGAPDQPFLKRKHMMSSEDQMVIQSHPKHLLDLLCTNKRLVGGVSCNGSDLQGPQRLAVLQSAQL